MCRWLAYSGTPVLMEDLLYKPKNSLITQSLHSQMGAETTNGDGFGVGWYGTVRRPACSTAPSRRGTTATSASSPGTWSHRRARPHPRVDRPPVQQTNCHPFRHDNWLFMHNGYIDGLRTVRRDLAMEVDPALFADIEGTTDTEMLFFLALTYGLSDDPPAAVARGGRLRRGDRSTHGVEFPIQMTVVTTDGTSDVGLPLLQRGPVAVALPQRRRLDPARPVPRQRDPPAALRRASLVVSEPLGDLRGAWEEVPESPPSTAVARSWLPSRRSSPRWRHDSAGRRPVGPRCRPCRRDSGRHAGPGGGWWSCSRRARRASWSRRCRGSCSWSGRRPTVPSSSRARCCSPRRRPCSG